MAQTIIYLLIYFVYVLRNNYRIILYRLQVGAISAPCSVQWPLVDLYHPQSPTIWFYLWVFSIFLPVAYPYFNCTRFLCLWQCQAPFGCEDGFTPPRIITVTHPLLVMTLEWNRRKEQLDRYCVPLASGYDAWRLILGLSTVVFIWHRIISLISAWHNTRLSHIHSATTLC